MTRSVELHVLRSQIKKSGVREALKKIAALVLLLFLLASASDTPCSAQSAANPFFVHSSQQGSLLSIAARWGMANCWGSNGPPPIHVCLTDEMGLGYSSFYGFNTSLNLVDRNDYGAIVSLDINRFNFFGSNGKVEETRSYGQYNLVKGDDLSGDNLTTIISVNTDFHLDAGLNLHVVKFRPRVQFVDYIQYMNLKNHTQHWYKSGASRYNLEGVGGVLEFSLLPFWPEWATMGIPNSITQNVTLAATIGAGGGVSYWSCAAEFNFLKYDVVGLGFANRSAQIRAEAGASIWQILEPPVTPQDMGRVDILMFYIQASAYM